MVRKKILVVDDDRNIVETVTLRLKKNGYQVINAFDGSQALTRAKKEKPDLILINIMMPQLNGILTTLKLKSNKDTKPIPVIIISGIKEREEQILARHVGAVDYIIKPFESEELLAKIDKALKNSRLKTPGSS